MDVAIANVGVRISGSRAVLDIVNQIFAEATRRLPEDERPLRIDVRGDDGIWTIAGDTAKSKKVLRPSALPQIAGAVVSSVLAEVGHHTGVRVGRATVVESNGDALVIVGDDWESSVVLGAHLHTRGWRFLGGDYVLAEPDGRYLVGLRKSLHVTSRSLPALPIRYRQAVEASPWYTTGGEIAFYAVNPALVAEHSPWADRARVRALLRFDGHIGISPALEDIGGDFEVAQGLELRHLAAAGVEIAKLVRGGFVETCNLLERWFTTLPAIPR